MLTDEEIRKEIVQDKETTGIATGFEMQAKLYQPNFYDLIIFTLCRL